jgi:hypothetical protein
VASSGLAGQAPAVSLERVRKAGVAIRAIKLDVELAAPAR